MSEQTGQLRETLANGFQELADKDTFFRYNQAANMGQLISQSEPSWDVLRGAAGLILTDATDGFWARTARKVRGFDVATAGAAADPEADHRTVEAFISGLKNRAVERGDDKIAGQLTQLHQRSNERDFRMDENRARIASNPNLDQRELRASSINKLKMICQVAGCLSLTSPLYEKPIARSVGINVLRMGVWLGERGERQFRRKVDNLINPKLNQSGISPIHRTKIRKS